MRRLIQMSPLFFLVLLPSTSLATETVTRINETQNPLDIDDKISLRLDFCRFVPTDSSSFVDQVTLRRLPPGSLLIRYDGLQSVVLKHIRNQYRRFVRQAVRRGWYVLDESITERDVYENTDRTVPDPRARVWWHRSWWQSLPPEKGGAPRIPYVHQVGEEIVWRLGPLSFTNTLKVKFDYVALFEVNPDPESLEHGREVSRVALDLRPLRSPTIGTRFRVSVKPRLRIGFPTHGEWINTLRAASLQMSFEIHHSQKKIIEADVEAKWRPRDGLTISFEVSLASW